MLEGFGEARSAEAASSISDAGLLRFTGGLPVGFGVSDLAPSLLKGFWLDDAAGAEGVILILGRESAAGCGCGFGVDDREGLDDSESGALFSSGLEDTGVDVPNLARRLARI